MNIYDIGSGLYTALAARGGLKRGVGEEVYRLTRVVIGLLAGAGLYRLLTNWLTAITDQLPMLSGTAGFLVVFFGAFVLMKKARGGIIQSADRTFGKAGRGAAAAVGALRGMILSITAGVAVALSDVRALDRLILDGSILGKLIRFFVGEA